MMSQILFCFGPYQEKLRDYSGIQSLLKGPDGMPAIIPRSSLRKISVLYSISSYQQFYLCDSSNQKENLNGQAYMLLKS